MSRPVRENDIQAVADLLSIAMPPVDPADLPGIRLQLRADIADAVPVLEPCLLESLVQLSLCHRCRR